MGNFGCIHRHHNYAWVVLVYATIRDTSRTVIIYVLNSSPPSSLSLFFFFFSQKIIIYQNDVVLVVNIKTSYTQCFIDRNAARGANEDASTLLVQVFVRK